MFDLSAFEPVAFERSHVSLLFLMFVCIRVFELCAFNCLLLLNVLLLNGLLLNVLLLNCLLLNFVPVNLLRLNFLLLNFIHIPCSFCF